MSKLTFYENGQTLVKTHTADSKIEVPVGIIPESILVIENTQVIDYSLNLYSDFNLKNLEKSIGTGVKVLTKTGNVYGL
jgi:hypothetical protein